MRKIFLLLLSLSAFCFTQASNTVEIVNLKTEYTETPMGIDIVQPRFSWHMKSAEHGAAQSAYRIIVTDENGKLVWDSGRTSSDISLNIKYNGTPLEPSTRYYWKVEVWNNKKKKYKAESWFETGLMNPDISAWNGAKWIGGTDEDMVLYAQYLPVFTIGYSMKLHKESNSVKAAFVYGANDNRLANRYKNIYQLENERDSSFLAIELDISSVETTGSAHIHIYRAGYHPNDRSYVPLKSFTVPDALIHENNKYETHKIKITSVFGYTHIYVNGEEKDNLVGEVNLNPLGRGGDFIAFPVVGDIGFSVPKGQQACFSQVEVRNFRSPSNVLFSEEVKVITNGSFVVADPSSNAMPMLRTTFDTTGKKVKKARLYVTSRGIYEIYMNGQRIGDDYFNPGLTQYNQRHLYQTYDVTGNIVNGKNALGAILGEGWWSGGATYVGEFWNFFGDRQSLLSKLVITYEDGKEQTIVSEPFSWKYYNDGPIRYSSFFQGQVYDANKESAVVGWTTPAYNDKNWKAAVEVTLDNHINRDSINKHFNMPMTDDFTNMKLIGQFGQTVKNIKELTAISVEEVRPGVYVYDMGQNMAGIPKILLNGMEAGKEINLRFAEVKYPDLPEYGSNTGMIMLENIRAAMAQDIYITKGGKETIHPRFTFHGYRFVEITGIDKPLPLEAVKADVLSSVHGLASYYETSNPKVNKLWENITWSTYSNFLSIPTDCPQRNERLGWSGDISVFSRTATYLADIPQFLRKHLLAMRNVQREDGRFPDIAPLGGGFGGILWGSAGITVPWESYLQYQDADMLAEHYGAMKQYIDYLVRQIDPQTNIMGNGYRRNWGSLGDWLSPEYDKSEKSLLWEAYFIYDLEVMKKIATILNKKEDAVYFDKLYSERKDFFNETYIDSQTGKTIHPDSSTVVDTQVSYVLPFAFDIWNNENKEKALPHFVATLQRHNNAERGTICPPYSLMTGFIGTAWISKALSDCGYTDVAYRLLQQTTYPSWLYSIEQGATTIWERTNSYTHTNGFGGNNQMNSFNHYSFGAVAAWMYNHSLGIERDEAYPGFKRFVLKPEPDLTGQMTYAKGHYDSMYGRIESGWKVDGQDCLYEFTVPANTSAILYLRAESLDAIDFGSHPGARYIESDNGRHLFELPSGAYKVRAKNYNPESHLHVRP